MFVDAPLHSWSQSTSFDRQSESRSDGSQLQELQITFRYTYKCDM